MLATLVIGLREGLEAALIVGMIAAFLRRNGISLTPMWLGIGAAALLSTLTGIALELVSAALPQRQQEAMETIIGAAAVIIVTYMILWMSKNSRNMKSALETHAGSALKGGSVTALAVMAFLAVLREGVETAVFMVAAFQSSLSPLAAGFGAVLGLGVASGIGFLLFRGAVKLNLAKFFKITGVFLVLVAAGLVMKSLRTAHEAGWLNVGQGNTVDLVWLAPNGSARAAILTGVFGVPSDPRVVELLGWVLYLAPMLAFILWPRAWRPTSAALPRLQFAAAGTLAVAAAVLTLAAPLGIPASPSPTGTTAALTSFGEPAATLRLGQGTLAGTSPGETSANSAAHPPLTLVETSADGTETTHQLTGHGTESHAGRTVSVYTAETTAGQSDGDAAVLTTRELAQLNGGRLPVGISATANPGPFTAAWKHQGNITVWAANGVLVDAVNTQATTVMLSGGGLGAARTVSLNDVNSWAVPAGQVSTTVSTLNNFQAISTDNRLWSAYLPTLCAAAALLLAGAARRNRRKLAKSDPESAPAPVPAGAEAPDPEPARL